MEIIYRKICIKPVVVIISACFIVNSILAEKVFAYSYSNAKEENINYSMTFINGTTKNGSNGSKESVSDGGTCNKCWMMGTAFSLSGDYSGNIIYNTHRHDIGWTVNYQNGILDEIIPSFQRSMPGGYPWIEAISVNLDGEVGKFYFSDYQGYCCPVSWDYLCDTYIDGEKGVLINNPSANNQWSFGKRFLSYYWMTKASTGTSGYSPLSAPNGNSSNWAGTYGFSLPLTGVSATLEKYPCDFYVNPNGGNWLNNYSTIQVGGYKVDGTVFDIETPTRAGYEFTGWTLNAVYYTAADATVATHYQTPSATVEAQLNNNSVYLGNAKTVSITANWKRKYDIAYCGVEQTTGTDYFDNNGGMDFSQISGNVILKRAPEDWKHEMTRSYIDTENGEEIVENTTATGVGWSVKKGVRAVQVGQYYKDETQVNTPELFIMSRNAGGVTNGCASSNYNGVMPVLAVSDMPIVNLYRVWDYGPVIEAYDLYYTLDNARNGEITKEALLAKAKAIDEEDGELIAGQDATKKTSFTVIDYQEEDFLQFDTEGMISETYEAVDSVGNITRRQIMVHIVDTALEKISVKNTTGTTRFISQKYLNNSNEMGGLEPDSIWKMEPEYEITLQSAVTNTENHAWERTYTFSKETIDEMQQYMLNQSVECFSTKAGLSDFYRAYLQPNLQ